MRLLREAAGYCDFLAVGLNSDASVRRLKGPSRPINPAEARAEVLSALEAVDATTIFDEDTPLALINAIRPDVLIKGGDYRPDQVVGKDEVESWGGRLVIVPLVEGHSTSAMVERAIERGTTLHRGSPIPAPHHTRTAGQATTPAVDASYSQESHPAVRPDRPE